MTSKTANYVLVSAVFVLSLLDAGMAQPRSSCNPTRKSVAEGSPNIQEACKVPSAEHTVIWKIDNGSGQDVEIATCPPAPANCTVTPLRQITKINLTWPDASDPTKSQLTIGGPIERETAPRQIKCQASGKNGSGLVSISSTAIDVFVPGQRPAGACSGGTYSENGVFKLGGRCNFTNTYSTLSCYYCAWFEVIATNVSKIPSDQTIVENLVTGSDGSTNYSCAFKKELPSVEGKYSISLEAEHSKVRINVSSTEFEIRNPSEPIHNCPVYVAEGENVHCMCKSHDLGKPVRAQPTWSQTSNQILEKNNVRRLDDGSVFTCGFLQGPRISYTLRVAYGPDEVHIASTSSRALTCIPIHVNPTPRFFWTRHDTGEVGREQTLNIDLDNVTQRWVVDCVVTNVENNGKSATARVDTDTLRKGNLTFAQAENAAESGDRFGTGLAIGVCIAVAITAAVFFVLILALRTRGWALPCSRVSKDQPKRQKKRESNHPLLNAEGRDSSRQTSEDGAFRVELEAAVSARTADERGHPEGASNYDMLDKTQAQTMSPYDSLQPRSAAAIDTLQTIPEDDSGPLYANRDCFMDSAAPVYANSYPGKPNMEPSSDESHF